MDRRISRANWSSKHNANNTYNNNLRSNRPVGAPPPAIPENSVSEPFPSQPRDHRRLQEIKRPHKIDNSGVNRRFSVKVGPTDAPTFDSQLSNLPPSLPTNASNLRSQAIAASALSSSKAQDHPIIRQEPTPQQSQVKPLNATTILTDLSSNNYSATYYVKSCLKDANATKIDKFTNDLTDLSSSNDDDVKHTITQSFNQVLDVSTAISETEKMLKEMKTSVGKLNDVLFQQMEEAQERLQSSPDSDGHSNAKKDNRRSVMILEKKWASNLNKLFKDVEGAQKFLSAIPGRHVLTESKRWGELNVITWKPIRPAHLIILNDRVLIATRKRTGEKKRTIATQCWPIKDVNITEMKSSDNEYTLSLKSGDMAFLFQTDSENEYIKIKTSFRRAKDELNNMIENERTKQKDINDSLRRLSATQERFRRNSEFLHDLSSQITHRRSRSIDLNENGGENTLNTLADIDEVILDLEIELGHHRFSNCVGLINGVNETSEKLSKVKTDEQFKILLKLKTLKIAEITERLVDLLSWEITNKSASNKDIVENINLFKILKLEDRARKILLESKSKQLDQLISNLRFEGDYKNYILQTSLIYFNFINKTFELYEDCFGKSTEKIFIINWVNETINSYNAIFKRQLMDHSKNSETYLSCVEISKKQCSQLKNKGINVDYLLDF